MMDTKTSMPSHYPEKTQDPAGIRTQALPITSQALLPGSLVAEECRIDVDILRIEFNHRQWHIQHAKHVTLKLRLDEWSP